MARDTEYILKLIEEHGMATAQDIFAAREAALNSDDIVDPVDVLLKQGKIQENELLSMLAQQYGWEFVDLNDFDIDPSVIDSLSVDIAQHYGVFPVMKHDDVITVAMSDPTDMEKLDTLRYLLGTDVDAVIAPDAQIQKMIAKYYHEEEEESDVDQQDFDASDQIIESSNAAANPGVQEDDDTPIIRLVTKLIVDAYKMKASDIHLEPMEKRDRVRYRIDGALREVDGPPKYLQPNVTSRVKILSGLDITEKRIPQDGRIRITVNGQDVDLRVSSIPTNFGESVVMRILDKASIQLDIPKLGFYADDLDLVTRIINYPDGIFLVTGPTGSGKTTSLYAFLNTINTPARKLITVEDPVEYQLPGINQVQVDRHVDMTFAAALRSMLRQAPNIIMVGEIRDLETADIAINASLTGHLVFSTLHTNDAPSSVTRLIDMGVKPFLVASSVRAIMAQRLVRRVCKNCMEPYTPSPDEIRLLHLDKDYLDSANLVHGRGCPACGGTGYKGRMGIYEIFLITEDMQYLIYNKESSDKLRAAARQSGMRTLREDGLRKAAAGTTTVSEVLAVTVGDEE